MSPNLRTSFWSRMGLQDEDRDVCVRAIQELYPAHSVKEFGEQGYCSFTLSVSSRLGSPERGGEYVVQIRPEQHALDSDVAAAARKTYGGLAPEVRGLECKLPERLQVVEMERMMGVPLSKVNVEHGSWEKQVKLVESFAKCVASAWPKSVDSIASRHGIHSRCHFLADIRRHSRADTPTEGLWMEQDCTGKVGRVIVPKLRKLAADLPDEALRARARDTLTQLLAIENYPVVLNHGDLIPSNILVDEASWAITGLVDWAEAEMLPFGTCLYGLEYLLGGFGSVSSVDGTATKPVWKYHKGSDALRAIYWQALKRERPKIGESVGDVACMRDVGVFLWFGYAWDEGAINRVINEADDTHELACLRAFLDVG